MSAKKSVLKKSGKPSAVKRPGNGEKVSSVPAAAELMLEDNHNGRGRKRPDQTKTETVAEREKRLATRKALTLKAFQMAYENHQRRKAS